MSELVDSVWRPAFSSTKMGGWKSVDMVRRYAHLAPNHLSERTKPIDTIFGTCVPNTSQLGKVENFK